MELSPSYRAVPASLAFPDLFETAGSYRETVDAIVRAAVPAVAAACIVDVIEDGVLTRRGVAVADAVVLPHFPAAPHVDSPEGVAVVARTGSARYYGRGWLAALARDDTTIAALGQTDLQSFSILPLRAGRRTIGVITFACKSDVGSDDGTLAAFARDAAVTIEMSSLREFGAEAQRRAEDTRVRMGILARTAGAFLESLDVAVAMQRFLDSTITAFADGAGVMLELAPRARTFVAGDFDESSVTSLATAAIAAARPTFTDAARVLSAPVLSGTRGAIVFTRRRSQATFTIDDLTLVEELAARVGAFLTVATTYAREKHVSRTLQFALRPQQLHPIDGLQIVAAYRPSEADTDIDVGGDWYDMIEIDGDRIAFVIGDVMGHGVESAAAMAQLRSGIAANLYAGLGPERSLANADRVLAGLDGATNFATAIVALYSRGSQTFSFSNAGHPPPLIRRKDKIDSPEEPSVMLGIERKANRTQTMTRLRPGDLVAFYTDGVFEDRDRGYEDGFRDVCEAVLGARDILDAERRLFALKPNATDDRTVLLFAIES